MNIATKIIAAFAAVAIGTFAAFLLTPERTAPEVRFVALGGRTFTTSELRGKVTVVNFWATWCPDCRREMPKMIEAQRRFSSRGYETIAVAVHDRPDRVAEYAHRQALPFRVALDASGSISQSFGRVRVTPTIFVIGRNGRLLRRYEGEPPWDDFDRVVERALAEPAS